MLKHYNLNKQYIGNIYNYTDESIVSELSTGDKTLTFTLRGKSDIQCEEYIQTEEQRYVVKEIQPGNDDTITYTCQLDLEPLEGSVFEIFTAADKTVTQAANLALVGTGWRVNTTLTKKRNVQCMKKTTLEILYLIRDAFMCEIRFDSINKIVYFAEQFGSDRGVYFRKDLNLKDVSVRTDSYDYCTRIIPIGKDDLRIDNNGKEYVENYQYSSKIRTIIWEDSSYEDADILQEDAEGKLEDLSKPKKSYSADIRDLAKLSADYDILSFGLGDTVWIVDEGKGVKEKQRIVKITEYPHDPEKNKCELSNTVLSWEEMQKKLEAAANAWEDVSNKDGSINGVHVYGISDGNKVIIQTEVTNNPTVQANAAGVAANTTAINGVVQDLTAVTARVGTIEASYLTATQIQANYAAINFANIDTANIDTAKVMNLFTQVGLIRDAVISQAKITGYLDAVKINAASIDAGTLSVDRLVIRGDNTSLVYAINNISGALQSQNVNTINGEVLTDRTILADKIVAHSITANEITTENIIGTGGWINLAAGTFNYGAGALVWNGSTLSVSGKVDATSGSLGGWTFTDKYMYSSANAPAANNMFMMPAGTTSSYTIAGYASTGWVFTSSNTFGVTKAGGLYTTSGRIGGWDISEHNIHSTNSSGNYVYLNDGSGNNQDVLVVRTGAGSTASPYDYPVWIRANGEFKATNAIIKGTVTATSGEIAGLTLSANKLTATNIEIASSDSTTGYSHITMKSPSSSSRFYFNGLYLCNAASLDAATKYIEMGGSDYGINMTGAISCGSLYSRSSITSASTITANYNEAMIKASNPTQGNLFAGLHASSTGLHGIYSNGYWNGSELAGAGRWLIYRNTGDHTCVESELYAHNEGYTTLRPVVGTNSGTDAVGVLVSGNATFGVYARWGGATMSGRSISCPASDIRLKENIEDSRVDALSVIDAIRIRQFDWKDKSRGHWDCGMVVDEMEKDIDPKLCIGGGEDDDGNISYKSVDTFYLQGYEVKAIQELHAEIRALKGQLKELKSKIA